MNTCPLSGRPVFPGSEQCSFSGPCLRFHFLGTLKHQLLTLFVKIVGKLEKVLDFCQPHLRFVSSRRDAVLSQDKVLGERGCLSFALSEKIGQQVHCQEDIPDGRRRHAQVTFVGEMVLSLVQLN